ncbi:hypothetical protein H8Z75_17520 [Xanthomonas citri pv. citri]|nr:hypothetical protein H8Z75_17520 [Xanthomonas citri pv. citri]
MSISVSRPCTSASTAQQVRWRMHASRELTALCNTRWHAWSALFWLNHLSVPHARTFFHRLAHQALDLAGRNVGKPQEQVHFQQLLIIKMRTTPCGRHHKLAAQFNHKLAAP